MKSMGHIALGMGGAIVALATYMAAFALVQRCFGAEAIPQSGEIATFGDFEFVLVTPGDWCAMTNAITRLQNVARRQYEYDIKTDEGRQRWHGERIRKEVDKDIRAVMYTYADGYEYVQKMEAGASKLRPVEGRRIVPPTSAMLQSTDTNAVPEGVKLMRQRRAKLKTGRTLNVTFGPGGKVIKAEEAK